MSNTIKIQMCYETVTPESAEVGDLADHGFAEPGGWRYSIADESFRGRCKRDGQEKALADMAPAPMEFSTVGEAVSELRRHGPFESSSWPEAAPDAYLIGPVVEDSSYYEKGESTRYSFHIEADDPNTVVEVLKGALR
jgi:hypothetical protein